jgi:hypothetical protein
LPENLKLAMMFQFWTILLPLLLLLLVVPQGIKLAQMPYLC